MLNVFAISLVLIGGLIAAVTKFIEQTRLIEHDFMIHGELQASRDLAGVVAQQNGNYLHGLRYRQLQPFWFGILLILCGNFLLLIGAVMELLNG